MMWLLGEKYLHALKSIKHKWFIDFRETLQNGSFNYFTKLFHKKKIIQENLKFQPVWIQTKLNILLEPELSVSRLFAKV